MGLLLCDKPELIFASPFTRLRSTQPEGFQNRGQRDYFGHMGEDMKEEWRKKSAVVIIIIIFVFPPDYWGDKVKQEETSGACETREREVHAGN